MEWCVFYCIFTDVAFHWLIVLYNVVAVSTYKLPRGWSIILYWGLRPIVLLFRSFGKGSSTHFSSVTAPIITPVCVCVQSTTCFATNCFKPVFSNNSQHPLWCNKFDSGRSLWGDQPLEKLILTHIPQSFMFSTPITYVPSPSTQTFNESMPKDFYSPPYVSCIKLQVCV